MVRPRNPNRSVVRTERVLIAITQPQKRELVEAAKKAKRSMASVIRTRVFGPTVE